jgi:hypothetical protein
LFILFAVTGYKRPITETFAIFNPSKKPMGFLDGLKPIFSKGENS